MSEVRSKKYVDEDVIKDVDGVVAVITRNTTTGKRSFGLFKEFDRDGDGEMERTALINERALDAVERLLPQLRKRLAELRAQDQRRSA